MSRFPVVVVLCGLLCAACASSGQWGGAPQKPKLGAWGVDLTSLDTAVKPGDDFFLHVNGGWLKTAEIPADRASTGSFQDLQILSEERLKTIVADLEKKPEDRLPVEERKLRDLYDAFMDTATIEAKGLTAVRADLDYLAGLKTPDDVAHAMGSVRLSTMSIFNIGIGVDDKNPNNYSVNLGQAGLGLPDRDYYLSSDAAIVKTRTAYRKYLADMMALAGLDDSEARADRVLALETEIAKVSWTRADRRDEDKVYNPMPVSALKTLAPDFAWDAFLAEGGIPLKKPDGNERYVIVAEKTAFAPLATIFKNTPVSTWRDYLTVHYLHTFSAYLPKRFDDLAFSFYGTVLTGRTQQLDRQTRAMHLLDQQLGEALGKLYVARYFPPEAKAKADRLVSNLLKAYEADIKTLGLDGSRHPRQGAGKDPPVHAQDRLSHQVARLFRLEGRARRSVGNAQRATMFEWNRDVGRINQPVDKTEWGMTPSTINAYYNPSFNEIVFPAAILQAPFFDPQCR